MGAVLENPQPGIHSEPLPWPPIPQPQQPQPQPQPRPEFQPSPPPPLPPSPPSHQTLTCEICVEPIESLTQIFQPENKKCGPHAFCTDCLHKYIKSKLDDSVSKIHCPSLVCSEYLDPHDCRRFIPPRLFIRWCDSLCNSALQGSKKSYCSNRNCSELILNECGENVTMVICPSCKSASCFQCKLPWHAGFRCGELRDQNNRDFVVLADQKKWISCPNCHQYVERTDGCDSMFCRCGTVFCYNCGRKQSLLHCTHCATWGYRCRNYCFIGAIIAVVISILGLWVLYIFVWKKCCT